MWVSIPISLDKPITTHDSGKPRLGGESDMRDQGVACLVHNVVALRNRGCYRSERMFTFYVQDQQRLEMLKAGLENAQSKELRQDLRCVLKAGIPGIMMWATEEDLEHEYKLHVVWVQKPKVISSAGFLPWPLVPRL